MSMRARVLIGVKARQEVQADPQQTQPEVHSPCRCRCQRRIQILPQTQVDGAIQTLLIGAILQVLQTQADGVPLIPQVTAAAPVEVVEAVEKADQFRTVRVPHFLPIVKTKEKQI